MGKDSAKGMVLSQTSLRSVEANANGISRRPRQEVQSNLTIKGDAVMSFLHSWDVRDAFWKTF